MKDGTIAVEVSTSLTLIQWPFLTDISLAWAAASIFDPNLVENEADTSTTRNEIDAVLANSEIGPWLYFNCILRDSQMFLPVADPVSQLTPPFSKHQILICSLSLICAGLKFSQLLCSPAGQLATNR